MKIAIDTSPLMNGHAVRGIGQYTTLLIESLKQRSGVTLVNSIKKADVIHYPFFELFYLTLPIIKSKPTLVTIHDVIPLIYSDNYPTGIRGSFKLFVQQFSLHNCAHIVTDSDCSKYDIVEKLFQRPDKITRVYLAANPQYEPASKDLINQVKNEYNLKRPYLLYVGDINFNKNLPQLLTSYANFVDRSNLVIISKSFKRSNPAAANLWKLIDQLRLEPAIRILNNIPGNDIQTMRALYSGASWYIQPSLYEGFGLPVLEAQACECPVISTHGGSLDEITGDSVIIADPGKLHLAIKKALEKTREQRSEYIIRGKQNVTRFSWAKTAEEMIKVYEKV